MGEPTFFEWIQEKVAILAWPLFLWSIRMTEDQYISSIYEQEKQRLASGGEKEGTK